MKNLISLIFMAALVFAIPAAQAELKPGNRPGKVVTEEGELVATVVKINYKTREITLQGPEGDPMTVEAGPDILNFDKIKKGDTVIAKYMESTAIFVWKPDEEVSISTQPEVEVESAAGSGKPRGLVVGTVSISATVKAIDYKKRTVDLLSPEGNVRRVKVPPDVKRLNEVKVGDIIVARITKSVAISVEKTVK